MNIVRNMNIPYQVQHHAYYVDSIQNLILQVKRKQEQFPVYARNVKVNYND